METKRPAFEVVKASGRTEAYDRQKILDSLARAGADQITAERILSGAEQRFHPGISTKKIFGTVMDLLEKEEHRAASVYDLKGSIRRLGPAGYSFETFVGEILREYGHRVRLRQAISGKCADHEIDVVAESGTGGKRQVRLVECKYHLTAGTMVDLKEMLYTWARLLDINERPGLERPFDGIMLVSNTRTSPDATRFARCRGIEILSWSYPPGAGLEVLIKDRSLYPVTILRSAAPFGPDFFSKAGFMLAKDFVGRDPGDLSIRLHIPLPRITALIKEAEGLLEPSTGRGYN